MSGSSPIIRSISGILVGALGVILSDGAKLLGLNGEDETERIGSVLMTGDGVKFGLYGCLVGVEGSVGGDVLSEGM